MTVSGSLHTLRLCCHRNTDLLHSSLISVSPVSLRWRWLSLGIKFYDSETLRIIYIIAEYGCAFSGLRIFYCCFQAFVQTVSEENVVAKYHGNGIIPDELLADDEGLCQSVRAWLHFVGKLYTELMAVSEQCLKNEVCPAVWR